MDYNEFMEILEKENLNNISFNEKNLLSDTVYFLRKMMDLLFIQQMNVLQYLGKYEIFKMRKMHTEMH